MEYLFFALMFFIVLMIFGGGCADVEKQKALLTLEKVKDFIGYCEKHKDELPANIRERFDDLDSFCCKSADDSNKSI